MVSFAGIFRTIDGIVTVTDHPDDVKRTTGLFKINDFTEAVIFRGIEGALEFCNKFLSNLQNEPIENIVKIATTSLAQNFKEYQKHDFSFIIISYRIPRQPIFYGLWYEGDSFKAEALHDLHIFTSEQDDLIKYLISKIYSEHMLIDEIVKLVSFITLQCIKVFPNIGYQFEMTTLSDKGLRKLSDGETKDNLHLAEKVDHRLKKTFSDFFLDCEDRS